MNKSYILIVLLTLLSVNVAGQTHDSCKASFADNTQDYFPVSMNEASKALKDLCKATNNGEISNADLIKVFQSLQVLHTELGVEVKKAMPEITQFLEFYSQPLFYLNNQVGKGMMPSHIIDQPDVLDPTNIKGIKLYKQGNGQLYTQEIPEREAVACLSQDKCNRAFIAYMQLLKTVYSPLARQPLNFADKYLTLKDKQWRAYIDESRSQTFLDIALTSALYEKFYTKKEHDFSAPPKVQWFGLRPNLIIENVSDALDGQQTQESLALEVIGFNYWQDGCFGYACGASIIVNYADRSQVKDTGVGIMFHVENSYSFGITKHGSETGFFVTVDLLKVFQDKKNAFDDYKEKYKGVGE